MSGAATQQAVWFEDGRVDVRRVAVPTSTPGGEELPAAGWELVRVELAGVCGTDLELVRGYAGFAGVPGHEFVGTIVTPDSTRRGRRVVGDINVGCGECRRCGAGEARHCRRRRVLGIRGLEGAFAETLALPAVNLHEVPAGMAPETAVFAEPLAAACRAVEQLGVAPSSPPTRVVVVGAGRLGALCGQALRAAGADVAVLARSGGGRELCKELGLATIAGPPPQPADAAVDATGSPGGAPLAMRCVRPEGTVVVKSTCRPGSGPELDWERLVVDEVRVLGSRCGDLRTALALLASGAVAVAPLIEQTLPLSEAPAALEQAATRGARKLLLRPTPATGTGPADQETRADPIGDGSS